MTPRDRDDSLDCGEFLGLLYPLQADELEPAVRERCERHLDRCATCAKRLELEGALARVLRRKLGRAVAPPGFAGRVRTALRNEFGSRPARTPWFRTPWFAVTATAVLSIALLLPGLTDGTGFRTAEDAIPVVRRVTVVDHDCDRAGKGLAEQRRCRQPLHVNALKLAGGGYWTISPGQVEYRHLLLDADSRGRRFEVEGDYYPGPRTIVLRRVVPLDRDRL